MEKSTVKVEIDGKKELGLVVGSNGQERGVHVMRVVPYSQSDGKIFPRDELLFLDSMPLSNKSAKFFTEYVKEKNKIGVMFTLTISRPPPEPSPPRDHQEKDATSSDAEEDEKIARNRMTVSEPSSTEVRDQQLGTEIITVSPGPLGIVIIEDHGIRVKQIKHDSQCKGKIQEGDWIVEVNGTALDHTATLVDFTAVIKTLIGVGYQAKILRWNKKWPAIRASHKVPNKRDTAKDSKEDDAKDDSDASLEELFKSRPSDNTRYKLSSKNDNGDERQNNDNSGDDDDDDATATATATTENQSVVVDNVPAPQQPKPSKKRPKRDSSKQSAENNNMQSKEVCDICGNPDKYLGSMRLQTCASCGLLVHEDCYGLHNEQNGAIHPGWKCHACASVGKTIKLVKQDGGIKDVRIQKRAVHCALCPISTGLHAMTPLYDTYGPKGQPIPAKSKNEEEGIMWVHSLCALVVGSSVGTNGMVYGCYEDGLHMGGEESESDEDESVEKICSFDLDYYGKDGSPLMLALLHHFVIEHECPIQLKRMEEFRTLKCIFCKHTDQKSKRIPVQCSYDDCELALHIGCGQWGREQSRIEFFPGYTEESGKSHDLVARGYCNKHYKMAKKVGRDLLSENKLLEFYETAHETERMTSTSLKSGEDGTIFDDDSSFDGDDKSADGSSSSEEDDNFITDIPPKQGTGTSTKRKILDNRLVPQSITPLNKKIRTTSTTKQSNSNLGPKVSGKTSAYFEKKKRIQQYSLQMVQDLEQRLKSGTSVRKAVKIVSGHWKNKLTPSEFRMCREKNDDDMNALILQYRRIEESQTQQTSTSKKPLEEREHTTNRWKDLFMPSFKFGSVLTAEWDKEEEIPPF